MYISMVRRVEGPRKTYRNVEFELDVEPNSDLQGDVGGDGRKVKETFGNVEAEHIDFNEYGSKTRVDQEWLGNPS